VVHTSSVQRGKKKKEGPICERRKKEEKKFNLIHQTFQANVAEFSSLGSSSQLLAFVHSRNLIVEKKRTSKINRKITKKTNGRKKKNTSHFSHLLQSFGEVGVIRMRGRSMLDEVLQEENITGNALNGHDEKTGKVQQLTIRMLSCFL
jgi:hypothetical protein